MTIFIAFYNQSKKNAKKGNVFFLTVVTQAYYYR